MQFRMPNYYKKFQCIADKCPDTCCAGWAIVIDDKTFDGYMDMQGEKGDYVREHLIEEERVYKRCGERCSFLNENNLCDLYINVGEDKLCKTCARYPRHFEEYGNLVEAALSISCPVAAELIIDSQEPDKFLVKNDDRTSPHAKEVDAHLLEALLKVRKDVFKIMSDRTVNVWERARRILELGEIIQPTVYEYEKLGWKRHVKVARDSVLDNMRAQHIIPVDVSFDAEAPYQYMQQFMDMLLGLENINKEWPERIRSVQSALYENINCDEYLKLRDEFNQYMESRQYEYEHIINYFIYTYFLGGVYDYHVQAMVKMSVLSALIIREMGFARWLTQDKVFTVEDQICVAYLYSRQLEHSDNNLMSLEGLLVAHPTFDKDKICSVC